MAQLSDAERDVAAAAFHRLVTPSGAKVALRVSDLADWTGVDAGALGACSRSLARGNWRVVRAIADPPATRRAAELRDLPRRPRRAGARLARAPRGAPAHPEDRPDRDRRGRRPRRDRDRRAGPRRVRATRRPTGRPPPSARPEARAAARPRPREQRRWRDWRSGRTRTRRSGTRWRRPRARGRTRRRSRCGKRWPATVSRRGSRPAHRRGARLRSLPAGHTPCDRGQGRRHPCVGAGEPRRRPLELKGDGRNVAFDRSGERVAVAGGAGDGLERRRAAAGAISSAAPRKRGRASRGVPTAAGLAAGGDGQAKVWSSLMTVPTHARHSRGHGRPHRVESRRPPHRNRRGRAASRSGPRRANRSPLCRAAGRSYPSRSARTARGCSSLAPTEPSMCWADGGGHCRCTDKRAMNVTCRRLHGGWPVSRLGPERSGRHAGPGGPPLGAHARVPEPADRAARRRAGHARFVAGGRAAARSTRRPTIDRCGCGTRSATPSWRRCPGWGTYTQLVARRAAEDEY